jgi:2-keto-3-deoxy-L-rhamnonate aldolase RhmA
MILKGVPNMKENKLRGLLNADRPTVATRIYSRWPFITEVIGATGLYDYVEFLAEYAPFTQEELENICLAAEKSNMGAIIKVDMQNRLYVLQKAIAAGFEGVLLTDHKTAADVEETIRCLRPDSPEDQGCFSFACRRFNYTSGGWGAGSLDDYKKLLRDTVVLLMVEKKETLENLEEILSVPGIDMLQWGPMDFSLSMGWDHREKQSELKALERRMIEIAGRYGVAVRCEIKQAESGRYYKDLGVRHFCLGDEIGNNVAFWTNQGNALRGIL